jgi:hypothetical protein
MRISAMDEPITLGGVPAPMRWLLTPEHWQVSDGAALTITAGPATETATSA